MQNYHITALVTLATDVPEPRVDGLKSGYAPHHKFPNVDYLASGFHYFSDKNLHFPGDTFLSKIVFPSWEFICKDIKVGDRFEISELHKPIGFGVVQSIEETRG